MIEFRVTAPGKLILHGEHAVVYGKTAVAASLDLRTTLHLKELTSSEKFVKISMPKIGVLANVPLSQYRDYFGSENCPRATDDHETFHAYVKNFVDQIGCANVQQKLSLESVFYLLISIGQSSGTSELRPFEMTLDTALSISSGLGSSASFSVCLAAGFVHWGHLRKGEVTTMNEEQLSEISEHAFNAERIIHGTPSGVDNSVCAYGSIIEFRRGERLQPIPGARPMRVLLVDTRVQRSTRALVEKMSGLKKKYPAIFAPVLESIDNVSKEALAVVKRIRELPDDMKEETSAAYRELMILIEVNQGLLATCQLSHPSLDRICAEAKNYGLAAKLTGAGGGGYAYILLLPDTPNETITSITKKLIANGYLVTLTNLGGPGVTIHEQ